MLLVHGLGMSAAAWAGTLAHLRPARRAVAFDLRGHGRSARGRAYAIEDFAADLLAVADALGLDRFVLVGHSFGASVAMAAAAAAPSRVAGLLLVDAAGAFEGAPPGALEQFLGTLRSPDGPDLLRETFEANLARAAPATRAAVLAGVAATPHEVMVGAYEALLGWQPARALARYPGPVRLVVDEQNDSPFSLHGQQPRRPRVAVAGASHWLCLDQPAAFLAALDGFLAEVDTGGAHARGGTG